MMLLNCVIGQEVVTESIFVLVINNLPALELRYRLKAAVIEPVIISSL